VVTGSSAGGVVVVDGAGVSGAGGVVAGCVSVSAVEVAGACELVVSLAPHPINARARAARTSKIPIFFMVRSPLEFGFLDYSGKAMERMISDLLLWRNPENTLGSRMYLQITG